MLFVMLEFERRQGSSWETAQCVYRSKIDLQSPAKWTLLGYRAECVVN